MTSKTFKVIMWVSCILFSITTIMAVGEISSTTHERGEVWMENDTVYWSNGTEVFWFNGFDIISTSSVDSSGSWWVEGDDIRWTDSDSYEKSISGTKKVLWWNKNWSYRKPVTLNNSEVGIKGVFEYVNISLDSGLSSSSPQDEIRVIDVAKGKEVSSNVIESGNSYALVAFNATLPYNASRKYHIYYGNPSPSSKSKVFNDYRVDFSAAGNDWDSSNPTYYWSNSGSYVSGPDWNSGSGTNAWQQWTNLNLFDMIHHKSIDQMVQEGKAREDVSGDDTVIVRDLNCDMTGDPNFNGANPSYCTNETDKFFGLFIAHDLTYNSGCYSVNPFTIVPNEYNYKRDTRDLDYTLAGYAYPDAASYGNYITNCDTNIASFGDDTYTILPLRNLADTSIGGEESLPHQKSNTSGEVWISSNGMIHYVDATGVERVSRHYPNCNAILKAGDTEGDGVYTINPDGVGGGEPFQVYCDMSKDGGGWTKLWFKKNRTDGYGFVSCESDKWRGEWSSSPVIDLDPECDQNVKEEFIEINYYDKNGDKINESQIDALSDMTTSTVYNGSMHFFDSDNNCDGGRAPVTTYNNSGPNGNSVNVFPSRGNPSDDTSHVICGGKGTDVENIVSGSWRTIMDNGLPLKFGVQSGSGDTGCWNCTGYSGGYGSTVELKETYFWTR